MTVNRCKKGQSVYLQTCNPAGWKNLKLRAAGSAARSSSLFSVDADSLNRDIHLVHLDADHALNAVLDRFDHVLGHGRDRHAVLHDDVQADGAAVFAQRHGRRA